MIIFYTHLSHVKIQFDRSFISLYIISLLHKFLFALHSTPKCWTLEIDERFKFLTQHHRVRPNTIVCVQNEKCPYFWRHSAVVCLYIFNDTQLSFVYLFLHFSRRDKSVRVWKIRSFEIVHYFFHTTLDTEMLNFRNRRRFNSYTQHRYEWNDLSLQYPTKTKVTVFQQHKIVVLSIYFYILLEARKIRTFRSFIYFVLRYSTPP